MNRLEAISVMDFIEYCVTDSTLFFDLLYDKKNKYIDLRITNEIGAFYPNQKSIEHERSIKRDRTFRLSGIEKYSIDKNTDLACDSILDVGHEKNEIWFLLGEGETLRVETNAEFKISTHSPHTFKEEIVFKSLVYKNQV